MEVTLKTGHRMQECAEEARFDKSRRGRSAGNQLTTLLK
jgi:hypothetical protein